MTKIIKNLAVSFVLTFAGLSTANADVLSFVKNVKVAGTKSFVAAEKFREGKTTEGVSIFELRLNERTFGKNSLFTQTEMNVESATLRILKLRVESTDVAIRAELGDKAEIRLAHFWEVLKNQESLHDKKSRIIAYVRDSKGVLLVLHGYWHPDFDGWWVTAVPASSTSGLKKSPSGSYADNLIISH